MAQHDYSLANQTGLEFRADLNNALQAIVTQNSGETEPTVTYPGMKWLDTSVSPAVTKERNQANDGWITTVASEAVIPITKGGTGATDAETARTNLNAQKTLVSGDNIKTINGVSLLGSGDLVIGGIPAGAVAYFAMASAPAGWLKANGAAVSRTTYAALFSAIGETYGAGDGSTTFNLPDLRGEFLRGLGDGRGVDAGRSIGSWQVDEFKSHTHTGTAASDGAHTHSLTFYKSKITGSGTDLNVSDVSSTPSSFNTSSGGAHTHSLTINATGGAETRPRNVAMLACIKY